MTKEEFILKSESRLSSLENDSKFKNYSKQLLADKLKADFNKNYKLDYLWRKSLIAISSSCFILENDTNSKIALKSLYKIANNLENISEIEESSSQFDVDFLRIRITRSADHFISPLEFFLFNLDSSLAIFIDPIPSKYIS